ncbi:Cell adhesion molecule 2 [Triplophysa tibetana]|uniref:Cell adhesion molecule 2 n=1 Tax=Triplophysa tibetana TaxID=1572043 RepID=A0A5A9N4F7_9TELE|nr:Cell adhesion molecule 2 [Triplophysa tibetana]
MTNTILWFSASTLMAKSQWHDYLQADFRDSDREGRPVKGTQGQFPIVQNITVTEGGIVNLTCRVENNDNNSLQWSNPAQQTLFFGDKKALRDNRIELVRATSQELTISISEVTLGDEGLYTCSLFTMPVKTAKAYVTVLGVPKKPEINGFTKPAMEGDLITLTCVTSGSKPAAEVRWFRNEKEIKGAKEVNASGRTFTVKSSLRLQVDRNDDGVAYTCKVDHVALTATPQQTTEVLEVHYAPRVEIKHSLIIPQEGQYLKLECVSKGNPSPDPVEWTKDGGELPDLDRMIVEGRELTFTSLNKTDNGTYRCEATNHLGTNHAEYVLFVYGATLRPHLPSLSSEPAAWLRSRAQNGYDCGHQAEEADSISPSTPTSPHHSSAFLTPNPSRRQNTSSPSQFQKFLLFLTFCPPVSSPRAP